MLPCNLCLSSHHRMPALSTNSKQLSHKQKAKKTTPTKAITLQYTNRQKFNKRQNTKPQIQTDYYDHQRRGWIHILCCMMYKLLEMLMTNWAVQGGACTEPNACRLVTILSWKMQNQIRDIHNFSSDHKTHHTEQNTFVCIEHMFVYKKQNH